MHYLAALALSLLLIGCHTPPHIDRMVSEFETNREALERLKTMIEEDRGERPCFGVGEDQIGRFEFYPGGPNESVALEGHGLTRERFDEYLGLLATVGGFEVGKCSGPDGSQTTIVMKMGAAVGPGPCSTVYAINSDRSIPEGRVRRGSSAEIIPLSGGWYIEYSCKTHTPTYVPARSVPAD